MGVEDGDAFVGETFTKPGAGVFRSGEFGIRDDDKPRLKLIEEEIADWLGFDWKAGDDDVRLQVRVAVQQSVLTGPAKIGEQEHTRLAECPKKNHRAVVCLRKMIGRIWVQDGPGADPIIAINAVEQARFAIKNV